MLKSIQQRDLKRNRWIKITMAVILGVICIAMVLTLIPGLNTGSANGPSPNSVATIGGQDISLSDVENQFEQNTRGQNVNQMLRPYLEQQALDQLIFERALELEADRLGISVTPQELAERIRQLLPDAWSGNTWLKDRYAADVQTRTGMSVPQFEAILRQDMLQTKFDHLVTDGIAVKPAEIERQFRLRNEKVAIQYALIKPSDLASTIHPSDADLAAYFNRNSARYQIPEKRSVRYALLDVSKLRASIHVSDDDLQAYYKAHIDDYKIQNSAHVEHILFKTLGKTDAEVAEIRKKADDVLKQAQATHGANFEDLAKKNSDDDATKAKGGDLGSIVDGQMAPQVQQVAFSLPKNSISGVIQTSYGFEIIKVLDRQEARTKSFEEVRASILPIVLGAEVNAEENGKANQLADAVRQSDRQPLDALAKNFGLQLGETQPAGLTEPVGPLGSSADLHQVVFQLSPGELSDPLHLANGIAILTVKDILPAHQATLAEVHDRVLADYQKEQSLGLARKRADDLASRVKGGEAFEKVAKEMGLDTKTSDPFARDGSVPDLGSGQQLEAAFNMNPGQVSAPQQIGGNWLVYRVASHTAPNQADFTSQKDGIQQQILQQKQDTAFDAFRDALENRLKKEGKLVISPDAVKLLTNQG